jgi:glycosyltransferase involved in cell wall biosynthesis
MHIAVNAHLLSPVGGYRQAGVSRYIEQLLRRLLPAGPEDAWTIYGPRGIAPLIEPTPRTRLRLSALPTTNPLARIVWEQCVAPLVVLRDRPSVMFCPLNVVPLAMRVPSVVCVHDLAFLRFPERFRASKRRYLSSLIRVSVHRAAHVLTVSEFTRREVIELLGVDPDKVTATPNGRDERIGPLPQPEIEAFRRRQNLPADFLLFLGTLEPRKNLITLLHAYARRRDELKLPLIVAGGKGWLYDSIFEAVGELGLRDDVRFAGFVPGDELGHWYNAATALIYPSLYEGFGLPPLEAMQCGTPVITSDASSVIEVVGDAGLIVGATDVEALGNALVQVASDAGLRAEMRERGLRRAHQFDWGQTAAGTIAALHAAARPGIKMS